VGGVDPQWATDQLAIRALAFRYASGVDRRDRQIFLSAFRPTATLRVHRSGPNGEDLVSTYSGHQEIARIPELITRYARTFHFVGNHLCDVTGDEATGEVYCTARHLTLDPQGNTDLVMFIRYQDVYRRDPGGPWLIDGRDVFVDWSEVNSGIVPS
jgi:hypothetical protein